MTENSPSFTSDQLADALRMTADAVKASGLTSVAEVEARFKEHLTGLLTASLEKVGTQAPRPSQDMRPAAERLADLGVMDVRQSDLVLVPPDENVPVAKPGADDEHDDGREWHGTPVDRLSPFFQALREAGIRWHDARVTVSAIASGSMRIAPYTMIWLPSVGKTALVCERTSNALFVMNGELTEAACAKLGKKELGALPGSVRIVWHENWKNNLLLAVSGNLPEKKTRDKNQISAAEMELLPWATKENDWMVDVLWPDGKTEPGRAVTNAMFSVQGARGPTILKHFAAWKESGTDIQKKWLAENVKEQGARTAGSPVKVVRASELEDFIKGELPCSEPGEANGWTTLLGWPDGKTEPGRAVTSRIPDIHGTLGETVLNRLVAWTESGTDAQKAWLDLNVQFGGARVENGKPITMVRSSALEDFIKGKLPCSDPCEANGWTTLLNWPGGNGGTVTEPGRAVTKEMSDVHGATSHTIRRRLAAWKESGTNAQKAWLGQNVQANGAKSRHGKLVTMVRVSGLKDFVEEKLPYSDPCEANGWMTLITWPDGKTEPGRTITRQGSDVHGAKSFTVIDRLTTLAESGTPQEKAWLAENVRFDGARGGNGRPVTAVRASALEEFCQRLLSK